MLDGQAILGSAFYKCHACNMLPPRWQYTQAAAELAGRRLERRCGAFEPAAFGMDASPHPG